MPSNKKPSKKYNPAKRARMDAFGGLRTLYRTAAAQSTEPLAADQTRDLGIAYHGALQALMTGKATADDCNTLALSANITMLLCEAGLGREYLEIAKAGQDAVVQVFARFARVGKAVPTGPDVRALQDMLELHDAQLAHEDCTEGKLVAALAECKRRIAARQVLEVA